MNITINTMISFPDNKAHYLPLPNKVLGINYFYSILFVFLGGRIEKMHGVNGTVFVFVLHLATSC